MKRFFKLRAGRVSACCLPLLAALIPALTNAQPVPAINSFNPISGTVGANVNIIGANFNPIASSNIVFFGAVKAAVLSASPTNLTVVVPAGSTFGPVTVTAGGLVAYSGQLFEPTFTGDGSNITAGSFAPSFNLPGANGPQSMCIADLDGDGKPDIAFVNGYGRLISIYRNVGTNGALLGAGSFAPRLDLSPATNGVTGDPYRLRAVDLDGDGRLDLIVCDVNSDHITIFQNLAVPGNLTTASFAAPFTLNAAYDTYFAAAADLDGDGRVDIVALNYGAKTISICKNIGAPGTLDANSFALPVILAAPGGPFEATVADLDGDGKPDLAVANSDSSTVAVYQNLATPGVITSNSFAPPVEMSGGGGNISAITAVDLDGDGKLDLVAGSGTGDSVNVFRNISDSGLLTTNSFAAHVDFGTPGWMHTISVADFNGDGKPDLGVVGELGSYMAIFQNTSTPGSFTVNSFGPRVDFGTGWNAWGIAAGDLDGDGRPDVVFGNYYDNTVQIYQNQTPFGAPAVCTPAPSGLVGWWQGEGNANDSAGTNNGTLSSSGVTFINGKVGQGFRLDGTNGYVQIPDSDALKPANVTVEAWVWLDPNVTTIPGLEYIIFKRNSSTYLFEGYSLLKQTLPNGDGTYTDRFSFVVSRSGNQVVTYSTTAAQRGVWYHVAGTYDGNQLTLYVNGAAEATAIAGFPLDYGTLPVFIGMSGEPDPYNGKLAGIIDEASIYNRALLTNEIQAVYSAGSAGKCPMFAAPIIIIQPTNQIVLAGGTASFNVAASGTPPLSYQWNFNGTNIGGATNTTLTLTNIQPGQAGNYAVLVTNLSGSALSSNAVLTVLVPATPPTIVAQTPSQVVLLSNAVAFSVTVSGSEPLSYFWQRNGTLIPGATNSIYTLNPAQLSDSGSKFNCLVTNAYGSAASTNVSLKVIDTIANDLCSGAILITTVACTNVQSTLKASSYGDPVPDCIADFGHGVWYQFTSPVVGRLIVDTFGSDFDTGLAVYTGSCDALTAVACNDDTDGVTSQVILPTAAGATYSILAGGYGSDAGNLVLHLNYLTPPAFTLQPTNQSVVVSSNASFTTLVSGSQPISFQWYFNNTPLADGGRVSGSTSPALNLTAIQTSDAGNYQLVASNMVGVVTSSVATLTPIILPPVITQQPLDRSVLVGSNVTFTVGVDGTPPYGYQWFFNGVPLADDGLHISGSAAASLSISNLTSADGGGYMLTVTNVSGSTNSTTAVLTVLVPPSITTQPIGRSVPPGLPTTFNAAVSGNPAPGYQWQLNGTNIPGATSSSYTSPAVGTNDLGFYHLVASNSVGVAVSADVQLTFGPVAAWGANFNNQCLPPPGLSNVTAVAGCSAASFAVRTDGTVSAWGTGTATNIPAGVSNVVAVAAIGGFGGYALRSDGTIASWNTISAPALSNIVMVAAGGNNFGYALRAEGTLTGWGSVPIPGFPAGLNHVTAIACGYNNAVALRNDGTIAAAGSGVVTNVPVGLSNVVAVAAGYTYGMALKANGAVVAWGSGTVTNLPAGMTNIIAISAGNAVGDNLGVAVRSDGTVVAWGDNSNGEASPPAALTNLVSIAGAAAPYHGLALVNDGSPVILHPPVGLTAYTGRNVTLRGDAVGAFPLTYQWLLNGTNIPGATNTSLVIPNVQFSQAGNYQVFVSNAVNTALSLPAPLTIVSNNILAFLSVPAGMTNYQGSKVSFGAAVLGSGPLRYQWYFAATNFGSPSVYAPVPGATNDLLALDPALAINTGNYYVAVSNQVSGITSLPVYERMLFAKAWGYLATDPPLIVTNATAIAVGNSGQGSVFGHYLVLKSDGKVAGWTGNFVSYGETNVSALSNSIVTAIAAGYQDSLALKSDGTVYAWGFNAFGETNVPAGLNGVTAIACGDYHDLALKSDGTVVGWGQNTYLQATNAAATNVVAIAAGGQNSIALRADGSAVTWGFTGSGQYPIPFNATNLVAVAAGGSHFLALRANGTVVGWGNNPYGQATIPANWTNIVAISAAMNHSVALRNDGTILTLGNYYNGPTSTPGSVPPDLANIVAITSGGDHDLGLFGTRAPSFTVHPWNRSVPSNVRTNITLTGKCAGVQPVHYQWQLNGTNVPGATNDTLILTNQPSQGQPIHFIQTGAYQLIASNAYGVVASKYAKITAFYPLADALNTPTDGKGSSLYSWITSGNAQWFGETNVSHDGVAAAQSGGIGALQETILQTTLVTNWSGRCTFWWKVSSEQDFDFLEFRLNGIVQTNISGEVNWQQVSVPVAAGTNVLMWRYSKDVSFDAGQDAGWVDQFAFIVDPPVITNQPASRTVNMNATVLFTVTAGGVPPLRYQWRQNSNVIGGNSPTLILNNVGRAQNGTYFVTITNSGGSTVSSNAVLKVLVPQLLSTPTLSPDGTVQLTSKDANGGLLSPADLPNFEAQVSTNLMNWVTLPNSLTLTNGMLELQDNNGPNRPVRFYRLLEH